MKRLLVLFTGGTIASGQGDGGKVPSKKRVDELSVRLHEALAGLPDVELVTAAPWGIPGLDSSSLRPSHWMEMTRLIAAELETGLSGVLVLHGTDTMANTASWMDLCFGSLPIPMILTGSQLTLDYVPEDALVNLRGAARACCFAPGGVWVYFNWKLFPGRSAHKRNSMNPDAFVSLGEPPLHFEPAWGLSGQASAGKRTLAVGYPRELDRLFNNPQRLNLVGERIRPVLCLPGCQPAFLGTEEFLILVGYGAGNADPAVLRQVAETYRDCQVKPQIIACSQAEEGRKEPDGYADVGLAGLKSEGFTVWGQQSYSLEFVHALCCYALATGLPPGPVLGRFLAPC